MAFLLIKFETDYADEFQVSGFVVFQKEQWEEHQRKVAALFQGKAAQRKVLRTLPADHDDSNYWEIYEEHREHDRSSVIEVAFGTNEFVSYSNHEEYLRAFAVSTLTDEQYQVLKSLFTIRGYSWEYGGKTNVITDVVKNGTVCLIDPDKKD